MGFLIGAFGLCVPGSSVAGLCGAGATRFPEHRLHRGRLQTESTGH
ncbi:hypothetical protein FTUN_5366 [Frigoriglobus tundricola]|uniref:Uncharacterized protein n=1 Tax=Frigoriglobus tundricola TaxID=2774151 RepID=A0A6M5YWL3_9BACT|nr:hypothetical protein FTUN_5366 [Frigoriglobus tundricola]